MPRTQLVITVLSRILGSIPIFMLFFFLPAGTWEYWQAWVYISILITPMFFAMFYLLKNNPELLERRMRLKEQRAEQRQILQFSYIFFLLAFILPGFDKRFGWSDLPTGVVLAADACVLLGYLIVFRVMQINSFASRVIEVAEDQKVIDTGLYSVVRHPMYVGAILLYVASPLALGSLWAVLPALGIIPIIVARTKDEELALEKDLPGYVEYKKKTKYRLIPFIW
ncbi:MAG: isoprenylcysteine carboxylmethyltransferase family protein [Anaerolineales bacterium]|nr:isoprenylcysteine carboxylmethyltransferase family protein [Anaerolineales bacterium]MBP6209090.1 isoprenylcysteine carboxylmethyltransferase family protein [Anaerolineales bacterium]